MSGPYNRVMPIRLGQNKEKNAKKRDGTVRRQTPAGALPLPPPPLPVMLPPQMGLMATGTDTVDDVIKEMERRRKRAQRFNAGGHSKKHKRPEHPNTNSWNESREDYRNLNAISSKSQYYDKDKRIVGRCANLEKSYLRLTSEPDPDLVRPMDVLERAYMLVMDKYERHNAGYKYLCDQFKSMRQDLRVQMIETPFTVKVYETHARIAIENGDIGEFNQCQSRLMVLYEKVKTKGKVEFYYYRILYYLMMENYQDINELKLWLIHTGVHDENVNNALKYAHFKMMGDYHEYMRIYDEEIKGLGKKILEFSLDKERLNILNKICWSYNQVSIEMLMNELKFKSASETIEYCRQLKIVLKERNGITYLDTRSSRVDVARMYTNSKKIDIKGQR